MSRKPDPSEYCHERLGEQFAESLSMYDTQRRVDVLVNEFFTDEMVAGKQVLDVGCGLGYFSEELANRGAIVTACDIGPNLLMATKNRVNCKTVLADALCLSDYFGEQQFDIVVSSECIEHTPDPGRALQQMALVLKPGGYLSVSTPNILWYPVVAMATALKLRPFDGYENFSSWRSLRNSLKKSNIQIKSEKGLHLFPFQFSYLNGLSTWCDNHLQFSRNLMINLCILGQKAEADDIK